jgi:hypothetical protein
MITQMMEVHRIRSMRRDLLLVRIQVTLSRLAEAKRQLTAAESKMSQIERFRRERARELRNTTQRELDLLAARAKLETVSLALHIEGEETQLAGDRNSLHQVEEKLSALQRIADEALALSDSEDDD